jgi:hypothetical protein
VKAVDFDAMPPTVVTETATAPAKPEGVLAVILVPPVETTTVVASCEPNVTAVAAVKWVPKIVTDVPLLVGPAEGLTRVTVGAST